MTLRAPLLILLVATGLASAQNPAPAPAPSPDDAKFEQVLLEVRKLATAQQFEQALAKLNEAEFLKPDSLIVQNARGSMYTSMKDYDKARECFKLAEALKPGSFEARFNLTELDFVQGNHEAAATSFSNLLVAHPDLQLPVRSLVQFKIVVCHIKLGQLAKAEELAKGFAFADKDPASYFTKASFAVQKGDYATADKWLGEAQKAFGGGEIVPYVDTLVEAGWLTLKKSGEEKK